MVTTSYDWSMQQITITGDDAINFTGNTTQGSFTESVDNVDEETALLPEGEELPWQMGTNFTVRLAEVFGDVDPNPDSGVGVEYVTIDGVDYNYVYMGYTTFDYTESGTNETISDTFAVIEVIGSGTNGTNEYYVLNLTSDTDPKNGSSGGRLSDLNMGPLYIQEGEVQPPCFSAGTKILAEFSEMSVENLSAGDRVWTMDHGLQSVRWIGSKHISGQELMRAKHLRPIVIKAGALGDNHPEADLRVSPQHRIYVRSTIAERMFGSSEILVAAKQLLGIPGIETVDAPEGVTYYHVLFDHHEVVFANGAFAESFYTGAQALNAVEEASKQEILEIFPELRVSETGVEGGFDPARPFISGHKARKLAARHMKNGKPLVAAA